MPTKSKRKAYYKEYERTHKAERKAYRLANKERIKARNKAYRLVNKDELRQKLRDWRRNNPDKYRKALKAYWLANEERLKAHRKSYRLAHQKEIKAQLKIYGLKHIEKIRDACRKHKALKRGNNHEPYVENYIFERDNWMCQLCGRKINKRFKWPNPLSKSIDHIIPLSKGGADAPINVQAAHLRCNMSKNAGNGGQLRLIG